MAMGNVLAPGKLNVNMNVTPLIDVLLVLLIIFMVTVPVPQHGLNAQVPRRSTAPNHQNEGAIVVRVLKEPSGGVHYEINQEGVNLRNLAARLGSIISIRADKEVFIQGDAGLDFSTIAHVLDIAKSAGADRVGLITPKNAI